MHDERVPEHKGVEPGQLVMPFYLLCDVSYSMVGDMVALNDSIERLRKAIVTQPVVDDVAQICIMTFSDSAQVVMPLSQMSSTQAPQLTVQGGTYYGTAFGELARTIEQDRRRLKAEGYQIYRPCAFFMTDGMPLDSDWHQTFVSTLTYNRQTKVGMTAHPVFVPFGFRDAPMNVLQSLAYPPEKGKWYLAANTGVKEALIGIIDIIMKTIVMSGQSAAAGQPTVVQQEPAEGSGIVHGNADDFI